MTDDDVTREGEELLAAAFHPASHQQRGEDDRVWYEKLSRAKIPAIIFMLSGMGTTGTIGARLEGRRDAARAMVDFRLSERTVETMRRLENTSSELSREGIRVARRVAGVSVFMALLATLLGVGVALWGQSQLEARREVKEVARVVSAALAEAQRSVGILAKLPASNDEWNAPSGIRFQLVLRKPLGSLATLAQMQAFLGGCEPDVVSELLSLNVTLAWVTVYKRGGVIFAPAPAQIQAEPDHGDVLAGVQRASKLLRQCLSTLEARL